ncbi:MAG: hypothetical protein IJ626_00935 [Muribaculaceae bacterium]|nr:hypothetical protein [Muribaculaceae bacterium]
MNTFKALMMAATVLLSVGLSSCKTQSALSSTQLPQVKQQPIQMILDSDFGSSTDDLFALMMLNHYIDDGLVDLKGVIVDREGEKNAGVVDIFNTYYGHPDIPVGLERNGVKNPRCFIPYNGICDLKDAKGSPLFKRSLDTSKLPDGYKLYRQLLSKADDKSIVIVAIGFATTLSQLIESGADEYSNLSGVDLLDKKVKSIYIQSGRFEAGDSLCGYNMRAASRQSAIFYDRLPRSVDLIMSPSNIGDGMNYLPQDVLVDLSTTEVNPIKSVYTNYTCDTGQRMWDTNCLVNAVLGDKEYIMSPRGWVTFVDKGEESLMLFKQDPAGNARYQLPGDSYFNENKLMDIRRHNRINKYPALYSIEAPQPQVTGWDAVAWASPRVGQLVDKYMGSAGNKLDPDNVRAMLRPIGFVGLNAGDYTRTVEMLTDTIYSTMLKRAITSGKKEVVIVTGPPASGKSTAVRKLNFKKAGVVYDADLSAGNSLEKAVTMAKAAGIEKITIVPVYNDLMTCYKNAINRGKTSYRFTGIDEMVASFRGNVGKIDEIKAKFPDVEIIPVDCTNNNGVKVVSMEDAAKWHFDLSEGDINTLMTYVLSQIELGEIYTYELPGAVGNVLSIPNMGESNKPIAAKLNEKVQEYTKEMR